MTTALLLMLSGLGLAIAGAFVAARLLRVPRLFAPGTLFAPADPATVVARLATPGAGADDHPLLALARHGLAAGMPEHALRDTLNAASIRRLRQLQRAHAIGRALGFAAPVAGLGLLFGAMATAAGSLSQAQAGGGITPASATGLMLLLVAVPLINLISRRFPKVAPGALLHAEHEALAITEGACALARGEGPAGASVKVREVLSGLPSWSAYGSSLARAA